MKRLKETKNQFCQTLETLENDPACCGKWKEIFKRTLSLLVCLVSILGLSLYSFLMLPMQRITRLPLLVDAVLSKLKTDDDEFESWKMTLAILNKVSLHCLQGHVRQLCYDV